MTEGPEDEHQYQALVTDRDGVIRHGGSECVGVFGYSSEEAIGKTLDLVVPAPCRLATGAASKRLSPPVG